MTRLFAHSPKVRPNSPRASVWAYSPIRPPVYRYGGEGRTQKATRQTAYSPRPEPPHAEAASGRSNVRHPAGQNVACRAATTDHLSIDQVRPTNMQVSGAASTGCQR